MDLPAAARVITRFAPSPTGPLHLGHAFSALTAWTLAQEAGGTFLLRIEDIDRARSKPRWEAQIEEDLAWLGLDWPRPPRRQSGHLDLYADVLDGLGQRGLLFPCRCNRADIRAAASAPHEGEPLTGPDGVIYPGTCRARAYADRKPGDALRLNMAAALATLGPGLGGWEETGGLRPGTHLLDRDMLLHGVGDVVLARRPDATPAYHLAVTVDDAAQGVTLVTRGMDLFDATQIHVLLQRLLALPTPRYHHHRLIRDATGERLAKRTDAAAIAAYRQTGETPADIRRRIGLPPDP